MFFHCSLKWQALHSTCNTTVHCMQILNYLMYNDYKHIIWWIILELDHHWWRCVQMLMSTPIQIFCSLDKWTPCWKKWFGYAVVVQSSTNPRSHSILSLLDREKSFAARTNWHYCCLPMHDYSGYDRTLWPARDVVVHRDRSYEHLNAEIKHQQKLIKNSIWYSLFSTHHSWPVEKLDNWLFSCLQWYCK